MSASTCTGRRSVIVRKTSDGEVLSKVHIDNDPIALAAAVAPAGPKPEVVLEATFGWYWAADVLADLGANVLSIEHHRTGIRLGFGDALVRLTLEARDHDHGDQLLAGLRSAGFTVDRA